MFPVSNQTVTSFGATRSWSGEEVARSLVAR
jgi:hypothetical protein